ncbi:hypothetical protein ACHAPQ_012134, partial [Fusarium lateritium]
VYKNGKKWATQKIQTTGEAAKLKLEADRVAIDADGEDLAFVKVAITDDKGRNVPDANNTITFSVTGPGEIVATDNGFGADFTSFHSKERNAFNGLALAIVRAKPRGKGSFTVKAEGGGLKAASVTIGLNRL